MSNTTSPPTTSHRVTAAKLRARVGYGPTKFNELIKSGVILPPRFDPGGRRRWWTGEEADESLRRLVAASVRSPALSGAVVGASDGNRARPTNGLAQQPRTAADTTP